MNKLKTSKIWNTGIFQFACVNFACDKAGNMTVCNERPQCLDSVAGPLIDLHIFVFCFLLLLLSLFFLLLIYPIPTHSIQILMAFVNTTASSPRKIPYPIKQTPTSIRITAGHLLFHILLVFNLFIYFPSVTFSNSFSTISFHSSRLWLPE